MPSVPYMNQSAPFWDFLASLEQQGSQHPLFAQGRDTENENEPEQAHDGHASPQPPFGPWGWGQFFGGPGGMPHRGPPPHDPPPHPHNNEGEAEKAHEEKDTDKDAEMNDNDDNDNGEGPSGNSGSDNEGRSHGRGHHGRCGGGRHGRCGPGGPGGFGPRHGPPRHGPWPHHGPQHYGPGSHGHHHGGRGPRGPRGRHNPWAAFGGGPFGGIFNPSAFTGASFDPSNIAAQFFNQFNDSHPTNNNNETTPETTTDYTPDADVFDTESAFVVHISLPGAKKEDVGVNWDAEKSELSVAGVTYRPGNEEFLKTLALDERKVGPFERKIRLGTRATPAHVDADGITAKLEDGVLRVEVPKMDGGFVEIRKVDIE